MGSIINEKYKGKYKGASDWIGELIKVQCVDEDPQKTGLSVDALFAMARNNNLNEVKLGELEGQKDQKNAPGRIRMTVGNMLRAAAKKRHGLYGVDGKWHKADQEFLDANGVEGDPVEGKDGESLKPKAEKAPKAENDGKKGKKKAA